MEVKILGPIFQVIYNLFNSAFPTIHQHSLSVQNRQTFSVPQNHNQTFFCLCTLSLRYPVVSRHLGPPKAQLLVPSVLNSLDLFDLPFLHYSSIYRWYCIIFPNSLMTLVSYSFFICNNLSPSRLKLPWEQSPHFLNFIVSDIVSSGAH